MTKTNKTALALKLFSSPLPNMTISSQFNLFFYSVQDAILLGRTHCTTVP